MEIPTPPAFWQSGSREPLGFQTGGEEGKGQAGPSPASIPEGPPPGLEGDASPSHFLSSRSSPPPASSPAGPPEPWAGVKEGPALRGSGGAAAKHL